jgi:hypothetical protein
MNSHSSRSHAIFSVTLSQQKQISLNDSRPSTPSTPTATRFGSPPSRAGSRLSSSRILMEDGDWVTITSKFNFVDLAGSERVSLYFVIF